jgi:hypothetical protein
MLHLVPLEIQVNLVMMENRDHLVNKENKDLKVQRVIKVTEEHLARMDKMD